MKLMVDRMSFEETDSVSTLGGGQVIGRSRTPDICLNSKPDGVSSGSFLSSGCSAPETHKYDKAQVLKILQVKVILSVEVVMGQRRKKSQRQLSNLCG